LQGLDSGQLLVTLARRNEQLSRAEARVAQLQEQLQQQQSQAGAAQDAAHSRQVAADARAAKQQEECMKQVIQLEYRCNKLEQEKAASTKQLQELQGVLLALEGAGSATGSARHQHRHRPHPSAAAAGQQPASSTEPVHLHTEELAGLSQGSSQKENDPAAANQQQAAAADDWRADAAAAVGPGSLLHRPAHIVQAPSFVKPGVGVAVGVAVRVAPCPHQPVPWQGAAGVPSSMG
jgi:chromosome segregation ATPase